MSICLWNGCPGHLIVSVHRESVNEPEWDGTQFKHNVQTGNQLSSGLKFLVLFPAKLWIMDLKNCL